MWIDAVKSLNSNYNKFTESRLMSIFRSKMSAGGGHSSVASSAVRALSLELKGIQEDPVEGFRVHLLNDDNLFDWEVAIFGPPDTLYAGGYFKVTSTVRVRMQSNSNC